MKKIFLYIFPFLIISCNDDNTVSEMPVISFENMIFKKSENNFTQDSLILTINFIDGNGDLGLSNDENSYPYHQYNAIIDESFNWVTIGSNDVNPPLYIYEPNGAITLFSDIDNRSEFNCNDYIIETSNSSNQSDTFLIQKNINNKNIYIEFYKKIGNDFELIDWTRVFDEEYGCGIDFNSRFPPLNIGNANQVLQGKLRYGMVSYGFENVLENNIFKLRIFVKDRALNSSNTIESKEVTLQEILSN
ncbi:MAG: hypothetical protein CMB83_06135 [Flammeovirgaceae bacterium]|nr:hypothetical protein [Flammeovirgaceae bacterium]